MVAKVFSVTITKIKILKYENIACEANKISNQIVILLIFVIVWYVWSTNWPTNQGNNNEAILDKNKKNKPNKKVVLCGFK